MPAMTKIDRLNRDIMTSVKLLQSLGYGCWYDQVKRRPWGEGFWHLRYQCWDGVMKAKPPLGISRDGAIDTLQRTAAELNILISKYFGLMEDDGQRPRLTDDLKLKGQE